MKDFFRTGEALGVSWFRLYLADALAGRYSEGFTESDLHLLRWLLVHMAVQASGGHMRTDLGQVGREMLEWYTSPGDTTVPGYDEDLPSRISERLPSLLSQGLSSGLINQLTETSQRANDLSVPRPPLVLSADGRHLYFLKRRRWEDDLLSLLSRRNVAGTEQGAFPGAKSLPEGPSGELMEKLSRGRRLLILAGGPGTGKTTTVAALLGLIARGRQESGRDFPKVALAAPTGRAAARLMESVKSAGLSLPEEKLTGRTLHGLLGMAPDRPPIHDAANPLDAELVVVDEASMVDLPMMNALLRALAEGAVLILVGDPDQLPSVEAGALLGDLLAGESRAADHGESPLAGSVVRLSTVYRSSTAILDAADAVRRGDIDALGSSFGADGVERMPLEDVETISRRLSHAYREVSASSEESASIPSPDRLERLAVLSPLRRGPWGVPEMNDRISLIMGGTTSPFPGMPIMVMRNDPDRNLWNGDRGIIIRDGDRLRALFGDGDRLRPLPLAVLPSWEPAWVQTIHKSQGSEFDEVFILLPRGAEKLLSREILYTALTRARNRVLLFAEDGAVEAALERQVVRHSRIRDWAAGD